MNPRDRITAAMTAQEPGTPLSCIGLAKLAAMTEEQVLAAMTEEELTEEVAALGRAVERVKGELASWQRQLRATAMHVASRRWGVAVGTVVTWRGHRWRVEGLVGYSPGTVTAEAVARLMVRDDKPALVVRREVRTFERWATRDNYIYDGRWEVEPAP